MTVVLQRNPSQRSLMAPTIANQNVHAIHRIGLGSVEATSYPVSRRLAIALDITVAKISFELVDQQFL
jgi:hypothetical protein